MYATVAQANEYIEAYYGSTDPLRLQWSELSEEDRLVRLTRAEQLIDLLPLNGYPSVQGKAFPREPFKKESLEKAKIATIELAIQTLDETAAERYSLQKQGVKSYKIGDLSETFKDGASGSKSSIVLSIVAPYLQKWLGGGYNFDHSYRRFGRWRIRILK